MDTVENYDITRVFEYMVRGRFCGCACHYRSIAVKWSTSGENSMTDFDKIRRMVDSYEKHLQEHNALWEREKLSPRVKATGDALDKEFSEICEEVTKSVHDLLQDFAKAGVGVSTIDTVTQYKEPYHAIWMRIGQTGRASKHFVVESFRYR